ncbi:MAG: phosphoesterase [Planctomycetia bacterium]|nr:phosphoesterase [Planctomycetia bacterium]
MQDEKVLVLPTAFFHELGYFQGFTSDLGKYLPQLLDPAVVRFRPRSEVEKDPNWKQLIPYMLFRHTNANGVVSLFRYTRGKGMGEGRLHLKHSVGVGGHLSECDSTSADTNTDVYHAGMLRERAEEVRLETTILREQIIGLINDDQNEVGKVHLGVVHLIDVAEPNVYPNEKEVLETGFFPIADQLKNLDGYESWSSITLQAYFGDGG